MSDLCQPRCRREGLAIFPAMYTAIPKEGARDFPALQVPFGADVTDKVLGDNVYALRGLEPGYVYVLYPNMRWAGYLVDRAGYLRYYPDLAVEDMPNTIPAKSDVEQCEQQKGKSHMGVEVLCIEQPETIEGVVHIAYSRVRWTAKVRTNYAANPADRMQPIEKLDGAAFKHAEVVSAKSLKDWVIDFHPARRPYMNWVLPTEIWVRDRAARAESLPKAMLAMSGELKVPGLIMALHDPMGIAMRLNASRNRLAAQAANLTGMGDEARARKRVVAEIIEGMRRNAEANPGPWYDRNYGPERYLNHIDQATWKDALTEQGALTNVLARIEVCSKDFVLWKESKAWRTAQERDFDGDVDASVRMHEELITSCVAGSGLTACEREQIWLSVLAMSGTDPNNWLVRALGAMHNGFLNYVDADNKEDKEYDAVKNATGLAKGWTETGVSKLAKLFADLGARRRATIATTALIESMAALLIRLREANPQKFNKLLRTVATVLIVRADVVPQPVVVRGTASRVAAAIHQIANAWKLPDGSAPVAYVPIDGKPGAQKGNFGPKAWELAEAAGAEVIFKAPGTEEETKTTVAWVLKKLRSGAQLDQTTLRSLGIKETNLPSFTPKDNPHLENHLARLGAKADIGLSAGAVFFQVYSFSVALKTYSKGATPDRIDGGVGMTTAVLSASAGIVEITAAVKMLSAQKAAAISLTRVAGWLSLVAGLIEGVYLIGKGGVKRFGTDDHDSAYWTMGTGVFVAMGGIASFGAAAAGAATIAAGEATAVTVVGIPAGPVVWTCLALALLAAGLYCSWQAWATDDNNLLPVEYWLDNGVFGKRQFVSGDVAGGNPYAVGGKAEPFVNLEREVQALQRVVMVAQVKFNATRDRNGVSIVCAYSVALPRYDVGTRLEITFTGLRAGQRFDAGKIVCENGAKTPAQACIEPRLTGMRKGPELKVDAKAATLRLEGVFSTMQGPTVVNKAVAFFSGKPDTNLYADHFEMRVSYWPDQVNMQDVMSERAVSA